MKMSENASQMEAQYNTTHTTFEKNCLTKKGYEIY